MLTEERTALGAVAATEQAVPSVLENLSASDDAVAAIASDGTPPPADASVQASTPADEALAQELSFAQRVDKACALLLQNPINRPICYRILRICEPERVLLNDLEERIQQQPEFAGVVQPPFFLIQWLVDVEALNVFDLDEDGNDVSPEQLEGLTADEIDDLIVNSAFQTSEIGREVLVEFSPQSRLINVLNIIPERYDTYVEVLEFLTEKRSLAAIDQLLRGRDVLMSGRKPGEGPMHPSVFVDKLADAGGIIFNGGWQITPEGKELLETIKAKGG
jgi:hypothetical protein